VHAVVDRFLEHARIIHFKNGGLDEVYISSADWMPRNFRRRVEVAFPIVDEALKRRVISEILATMQADNAKGWVLRSDGTYERLSGGNGAAAVRSQQRFVELARERAREADPILSLSSRQLTAVTGFERLRPKGRKKRKRKRNRD
jgi:polyphosphate kinase